MFIAYKDLVHLLPSLFMLGLAATVMITGAAQSAEEQRALREAAIRAIQVQRAREAARAEELRRIYERGKMMSHGRS